jgi:hypothetical protein
MVTKLSIIINKKENRILHILFIAFFLLLLTVEEFGATSCFDTLSFDRVLGPPCLGGVRQ